jgi:hypothetical protein
VLAAELSGEGMRHATTRSIARQISIRSAMRNCRDVWPAKIRNLRPAHARRNRHEHDEAQLG